MKQDDASLAAVGKSAGDFNPSTLSPWDVVVVPFPFTDRTATKRRPALVLSSTRFHGAARHSVLAMITSADQSAWPGDVPIQDLAAAGLGQPCLARMKLFTLDHRLLLRRCGHLDIGDAQLVARAWAPYLKLSS